MPSRLAAQPGSASSVTDADCVAVCSYLSAVRTDAAPHRALRVAPQPVDVNATEETARGLGAARSLALSMNGPNRILIIRINMQSAGLATATPSYCDEACVQVCADAGCVMLLLLLPLWMCNR
jgi:hypothetical protein